eukprot:SAG31_NODE_9020_length_1347_cov_1.032853_1_plen_49_part_00
MRRGREVTAQVKVTATSFTWRRACTAVSKFTMYGYVYDSTKLTTKYYT